MSLEGRIALVSGGNRGIGAGIALELARAGADIAVNYRRDEASAKETVAKIEALGRRAKMYQASVDDFEQDKAMVEAATRDLGVIDILVNNAGIASKGKTVEDTDPAEMERVVRTHAFGAHHLCKLVVPNMKKCDRGDIAMISSVQTKGYMPGGAPYGMGKAALEALAFGLAKEVRDFGIRVNIVAPGLVETEMGRRITRAYGSSIEESKAKATFGDVIQPSDVGKMVCFLASEEARFVSGQRIYIDQGA